MARRIGLNRVTTRETSGPEPTVAGSDSRWPSVGRFAGGAVILVVVLLTAVWLLAPESALGRMIEASAALKALAFPLILVVIFRKLFLIFSGRIGLRDLRRK